MQDRTPAPKAEVCLVRATLADAENLHRMKHAAFWPLYERYHDDAMSPALELLSKVKSQLESPATDWYILRLGETDVGGLRIVREHTEDGLPTCRISPLFVLPEHQRRGVASAALTTAFSLYPEAVLWQISAILQERDTVRLYERHCFRRTETEPTAYPGMDIVHFVRLREDVPMRRLTRLTDANLLGTEGVSHAAPRFTARAILKGCGDGSARYAVTHTDGFGIHMLPGGGVEPGESILQALHRELYEETGCRITSAEPLGYVEENRAHSDYTQLSFYFLCTTDDTELSPHLTETELSHGATVSWMTLQEMQEAICTPVFDRPQGKFLQARDMAALRAYMDKSPANP